MFRPFFSPGGARPYQHSETEGYWQITLAEGIKPVVPDTEITNNERTGGEEKGGDKYAAASATPNSIVIRVWAAEKRRKNNSEKKGLCLSSPQNHSSCSGWNPFTQSRPVSQTQT